MPGTMDGPALVRAVRQRHPDFPIIMISGSVDAEQQGREAGVSRFLEKPTITQYLVSTVKDLLQLPGETSSS